MRTPILIALGAFLATATLIKAAPALAEPVESSSVQVVHTSDLDLGTRAGRSALDHRLDVAAYEACGTASHVDLAGRNEARACRREVLARARERGEQLASRGAARLVVTASR